MNKEFKEILIRHLEKYPLMQEEDVYKLAYQFSFGPGHFFINEEQAYKRLLNEAKEVGASKEELIEVGNGYYRFHLSNDPSILKTIYEAFIKTVKENKPRNVNFESLLNEISDYLKELNISFDINNFLILIKEMKEKGYPAISHSDLYRNTYHPHYLLVKKL